MAHGRALAASAPHARYIEVAGQDHLSLPMQLDTLAPAFLDWFGQPACDAHAGLAGATAPAPPTGGGHG